MVLNIVHNRGNVLMLRGIHGQKTFLEHCLMSSFRCKVLGKTSRKISTLSSAHFLMIPFPQLDSFIN